MVRFGLNLGLNSLFLFSVLASDRVIGDSSAASLGSLCSPVFTPVMHNFHVSTSSRCVHREHKFKLLLKCRGVE